MLAGLGIWLAVVLVGNAKEASLREPFVFMDFEYFTDAIKHPRLYLPFLGLWRAIALGIIAVAVIGAALWAETPLTAQMPWLVFLKYNALSFSLQPACSGWATAGLTHPACSRTKIFATWVLPPVSGYTAGQNGPLFRCLLPGPLVPGQNRRIFRFKPEHPGTPQSYRVTRSSGHRPERIVF
jgi:hypothetical protein